jgi:hypothetical protein
MLDTASLGIPSRDASMQRCWRLPVLRQPTSTVMSLMAWSSKSMAARYQHLTNSLRSRVASEVGDLIWSPATDPGQTNRAGQLRGTRLLRLKLGQEAIMVINVSSRSGIAAGQWRWRWDLNPRMSCPITRFRGVRPRPLGDSTGAEPT